MSNPEKPRKIDIPDKPLIPKLAFDAHPIIEAMGYNKGIDAMSTWLEGEVVTKDSIELEIHRYFDKGLKSDKPTNITIDFLAQAIHALLTRKIKGE